MKLGTGGDYCCLIAGVETAAKQVEIAARKAGIKRGAAVKLSRFRVDRYREKLDRHSCLSR